MGGRGSRRPAAARASRASGRPCTTSSRSGTRLLYAGPVDDDAPISFGAPTEETALVGAGITHHVAWRAADDAEQAIWLARLGEIGLRPTAVQDRKYFRSIYFRMPDGILIEIATDGPGFLVDEPPRRSATSLSLPPWLEDERATLERELAPIA